MSYYRIQEYTARYEHHYRCGCTVPPGKKWADGWVVEMSTSAGPAYNGSTHRQLDSNVTCPRRLKLVRSVPVMGTREVLIPKPDMDWGFLHLQRLAKNCAVPVAAVMWCGQTNDWYYGCCRHGMNPADPSHGVPIAVSAAIIAQDREKMPESDCYGMNCAEVECVIAAYRAGRTLGNLSGCSFLARRTATGPLSACKTCRVWVTAMNGRYADYSGGKFRSWVTG